MKTEITPEMLKVIAEGMGYKTCSTGNGEFIAYQCHDENNEYSPITNAEQCMEIMEKLEVCLSRLMKPDAWQAVINDLVTREEIFAEGKTINEAVCLAAYEYFKDKQ